MNPTYPKGLPLGLHSGRSYQLVDPMQRSTMVSGQARQRRRFTDVPEIGSVSWLFSSVQSRLFISWWKGALGDGVVWFEMPLDHPGLGLREYTCRFTGVYTGPSRVGPDLWSFSAELELKERAAMDPDWAEVAPDYILGADIFDYAMNREWPLNQWQRYSEAADNAINKDWPKP